jgi:hypothetical protein
VKFKDEQTKRIGFRDNIIYVTIVAVGSVLSFSLENSAHHNGFFVVTCVTLIL